MRYLASSTRLIDYPFIVGFFKSEEALPTGWLSAAFTMEGSLPLAYGFDFVCFGLRLLTPFRPMNHSFIGLFPNQASSLT
jgi:hypothetical protein